MFLQPATNLSATQSSRPLSTAAVPNGAFSRVQKAAGAFTADGGMETGNTRQQSVTTLLSLDKKPAMAPSSAPIGILLATPIGEALALGEAFRFSFAISDSMPTVVNYGC